MQIDTDNSSNGEKAAALVALLLWLSEKGRTAAGYVWEATTDDQREAIAEASVWIEDVSQGKDPR